MKIRKPLVAGNWKMNGDTAFTGRLLPQLCAGLAAEPASAAAEIVVCPPFPYLGQAAGLLRGSAIAWGAQNVSAQPDGAFTGEVSTAMLLDLGCRWVIVGHSERRTLLGETDEDVAAKAIAAARAGLGVIACVGETLDEREADRTEAVLGRQADAIVRVFNGHRAGGAADADAQNGKGDREALSARLVLAYEPVWAIGTGRTASPEIAQQAHRYLRTRLAPLDGAGETTRILYGGSMKPDNAQALLAMPDVDGGLIGGAALVADDFLAICAAAARA